MFVSCLAAFPSASTYAINTLIIVWLVLIAEIDCYFISLNCRNRWYPSLTIQMRKIWPKENCNSNKCVILVFSRAFTNDNIQYIPGKPTWVCILLFFKIFAFIVLHERLQGSHRIWLTTQPCPRWTSDQKKPGWQGFEVKGMLASPHKAHSVPRSSLKPGNALLRPTHTASGFGFLRLARKFIKSFTHSTILQSTCNHGTPENVPATREGQSLPPEWRQTTWAHSRVRSTVKTRPQHSGTFSRRRWYYSDAVAQALRRCV